MKIKITRPDGTTIEAEGTAEECERIAREPYPPQTWQVPVYMPYHVEPVRPYEPFVVTWRLADGAFAGSSATITIGEVS